MFGCEEVFGMDLKLVADHISQLNVDRVSKHTYDCSKVSKPILK